jgi:hypothetical protein
MIVMHGIYSSNFLTNVTIEELTPQTFILREKTGGDRLIGMDRKSQLTSALSIGTPTFSEIAYHPDTIKCAKPVAPRPMMASRISIGIGDSSQLFFLFSRLGGL